MIETVFLLIADEVITAFGRTGDWSGSRHWGVQPDLMRSTKAITNGYFPSGAVMLSQQMADVLENDKSGAANIGHGYTYSGHPVGAAAAIACLTETKRLNVKDNAAARGTQLFEGFEGLMEKHQAIGNVRGGHGLMTAIEFVEDRETKAPMNKKTMGMIAEKIYSEGVMVFVSGHNILLSPPLIIGETEADKIISAIDAALSV